MFVCNCYKVTDHQIKSAMEQGATTLAEIQHKTDLGTNCGACLQHAEMIIKEFHGQEPSFNFALATQIA